MSDHKSFLKWAGGKIKLLPKLRALGIESGKRFIEPFVGSGVVSLNMPHPKIIIGDTNEGLIGLWYFLKDHHLIELKSDTKNVTIEHLRTFFNPAYNNKHKYYEFRDAFNGASEYKEGLFLYLNKHCFNGLCRFNSKGEFNVPYNHRVTPPAFPEKELLHAIEVSKRMSIFLGSFVDTMKLAKKGDMVYLDPPYSPLTADSFVDYSKDGFGFEEHIKLRDLALLAKTNGATVIISNNNTEETRRFYKDADEIHFIDVQKNISCKGNGRGKQSEIIAVYRPK